MSGKFSRSTLAGVGLMGAPTAGAIVCLIAESSPARLAIELGLIIYFFGVFAVATRPLVLKLLSVEKADAEIVVVKALFLSILASVALILLGILNLMGVVPWR